MCLIGTRSWRQTANEKRYLLQGMYLAIHNLLKPLLTRHVFRCSSGIGEALAREFQARGILLTRWVHTSRHSTSKMLTYSSLPPIRLSCYRYRSKIGKHMSP